MPIGEIKTLKEVNYVHGLRRNILSINQMRDVSNFYIFGPK